jgi:hypothetical protein
MYSKQEARLRYLFTQGWIERGDTDGANDEGKAGSNDSYAARVLRERAKPKVIGRVREGGRTITLGEDERTKRKKKQRKRPRKYDKEIVVALLKVWVIRDCICGKRLGVHLSEIIPVLEWLGEGHDGGGRAACGTCTNACLCRARLPCLKETKNACVACPIVER